MGLEHSKKKPKILVCEREVKKVHFIIMSNTKIRMTTKELDEVAQNVYNEIQSPINLTRCRISKKIVMAEREISCEIEAKGGNSGTDWIIKVNDYPLLIEFVS